RRFAAMLAILLFVGMEAERSRVVRSVPAVAGMVMGLQPDNREHCAESGVSSGPQKGEEEGQDEDLEGRAHHVSRKESPQSAGCQPAIRETVSPEPPFGTPFPFASSARPRHTRGCPEPSSSPPT